MIHITDANEPLVELKNPNTSENLKKAARIKKVTIGNLDLMNNDDAIVPDVKYHRNYYQTFPMKSKLEKIEKSKQVTADLVSHGNFHLPDQNVILILKTDFYLRSAFFSERTNIKTKYLKNWLNVLTIEL